MPTAVFLAISDLPHPSQLLRNKTCSVVIFNTADERPKKKSVLELNVVIHYI